MQNLFNGINCVLHSIIPILLLDSPLFMFFILLIHLFFYGCETRSLYCQCKGELQQFFKQGLFAFEVYANIPKLQIA
jgi:hypothetical protein